VEKLLFKDEVFQIIGCAIEILNTLGHGIVEKHYENALVVEFGLRQIPFSHRLMNSCSFVSIRDC
jgi:GxxExxY protein